MSIILYEQIPAIYFQLTSKEKPCSYLFTHYSPTQMHEFIMLLHTQVMNLGSYQESGNLEQL